MARKLDAQFDGQYLMSSVLMTSIMKSEPGTPPMRDAVNSFGVWVSAAATCMLGGSADGTRGADAALGDIACVAAFATGGVTAVAAPATVTPAKNLRRLTSRRDSGCGDFLAMDLLPLNVLHGSARGTCERMPADAYLLSRIISLPTRRGKAVATHSRMARLWFPRRRQSGILSRVNAPG